MTDNRQNENRKENGKDKNKNNHSRTLSRMMGTLRHKSNRSRTLLSYPSRSDEPVPSSNRGSYLHSSDNNTPTFDEPFEIIPIPSTTMVDVNSFTDEEVRERIIRIMDDMSEENETREKMLQQLTPASMRIMLTSHIQREAEEIADAQYQIQCLNHFTVDNINTKNSKETFEHVAFSLKKYSLKWSKVFGENLNGPNAMLKAMRACITKVQITREKFNQDENETQEKQVSLQEILGAGIEAFRNYFNLGWNFNSMKESLAKNIAEITIDVLNILSFNSDVHSIKIKSSCAILLFALAMPNENNPSNGQNIVELLSKSAKKWYQHRESFHCLVHELDGSIEVASSFLMCINAIFLTLTTEQRYHLRTELFRSGFKTSFEELQRRVVDCEDCKQKDNLSSQIELFLRHIDLDYQAMNIKFDFVSDSWANLQACFDYLHGLVKGSQSESLLLCILSRIICIRDDQTVRYSYLRLIDECITRIVFSKTACDPDFDTYSMDRESIGDSGFNDDISSIRNDSSHDLSRIPGSAGNSLQATQDQIQNDVMKGRIEHLENTREKLTKALETVLAKVDAETVNSLKIQYPDIKLSTPVPETIGNIPLSTENMPPPPSPPPIFNTPMPPPPPPDGSTEGISPPPPPVPDSIPPPPPSPMMLGDGPPSPPPPRTMLEDGPPPQMMLGDGPPSPPPPRTMLEDGPPPPMMLGDGPPPPPPPMMLGDGPPPPPPPPMMLGDGPPPPPPPRTMLEDGPPPQMMLGDGPPPPPPPMMLGDGPPPPPPPPPMMLGDGPPPPPPPMMLGDGPPPPPPLPAGGDPPGLPPVNPLFPGRPPLPEYLQAKQKYVVDEALKRVNWNKINPQSIPKDSIWANIDEKNCQNKTFFASIKENFATKIVPIKVLVDSDNESAPRITPPRSQFRVLDPRAGQNFAIMFSQLKSTPLQFRQWLLACDSEHLTGNLLAQLNKSLPSTDELKKLSELKNEINDLPDSEQYFCAISDIKRLHQRIKILLFKSEYKEKLDGTEKQLVAGRQACETVRRSKRFPKLIELVLTIGNYMNSSVKTYVPIYGFDISSLPKLHNTKANDGKRTLLHFILQEIEKDHKDLLQFGDEFHGVTEVASKIDINELQRTLNEIKVRVDSAQKDLDTAKNTPADSTSEDRFVEAMEGFINAAQDDIERLEALNVKMRNAYQDLCDYFVMDSNKCPLNEFFTDLKAFCTLFLICLQENRLWREQDEKNKRAQISKQLVDDIRKKQRAESKTEPKSFFKPNDEDTDVVSNLMSVLKDANMSSQPRRVRRPPASLSRDVPVVT